MFDGYDLLDKEIQLKKKLQDLTVTIKCDLALVDSILAEIKTLSAQANDVVLEMQQLGLLNEEIPMIYRQDFINRQCM